MIKSLWRDNRTIFAMMLFLCAALISGCDVVYRLLQKEGAEEKEILGEVVPMEPNVRVEEVQKLLKLYGYRIGKVDGILGGNTRQAIEDFQQDQGLKASRFVDFKTWDALTRFERFGLVVDGELNATAIQTSLKEAGLDPGPIDGKMGKKTQKAILHFQKLEGIKADGNIGINTLTHLEMYLSENHP